MIFGALAFLLMGMTLGLIGGGGSILTVPILVYIYGLSPQDATGSSLFIVGATAMVGATLAALKKEINLAQSLPFAIPSLIGVFISRTFLVPGTPDPVIHWSFLFVSKDMLLMILFAILMVTASFKMIRSSLQIEAVSTVNHWVIAQQGLFVGILTGFVGAGGGFLIIPALVFLLKFTMRQAAGTSLFIIAMNSSLGFLSDWLINNNKDWFLLLNSLAIAILGLCLGRWLAPSFSEKSLKRLFGWFVLILGSCILFQQIFTTHVG